ncbi:hypothetical protein [Amorphus sp. 3PC139-8]|uniref:hypothetical protein n=1 Tax=Amorphus sp. 3PC139-8 TaxID=2735676 RepID=UPI00345DF0A5
MARSDMARQGALRRIALLRAAVLFLAFTCASTPALAVEFPPEIIGSYAPGGKCTGFWRVQVHPEMIEFHDDMGDSLRMTLWDVCYACAGGASYQGIERWVSPIVDDWGKVPVFRFNADEVPGRLVIVYRGESFRGILPRLQDAIEASPLQKCE